MEKEERQRVKNRGKSQVIRQNTDLKESQFWNSQLEKGRI